MLLELLCRFNKGLTQEQIEEIKDRLETNRLIGGDNFDADEMYKKLAKEYMQYEYDVMTVHINDIRNFNPVDKEHVCIRFEDGGSFVYRITYDEFQEVYASLLHTNIYRVLPNKTKKDE